MKIGTNRNLEDPTGFGTSPGFCSTTQRMYGILFNFCPNKAVAFFRRPVFAFLLLAFAASSKWPGKGSDDGRQNLETPTKMSMFPPWSSCSWADESLTCQTNCIGLFFRKVHAISGPSQSGGLAS